MSGYLLSINLSHERKAIYGTMLSGGLLAMQMQRLVITLLWKPV
jgi:hypothetical protein